MSERDEANMGEVQDGKAGAKRKSLLGLVFAIGLMLIISIFLLAVKFTQTQDLRSIMSAVKHVFGGG